MNLSTYPQLTYADSDDQLISLWISQKATTTQQTYSMVVQQLFSFTGKPLKEIKLDDLTLWLESFRLRQVAIPTLNNKLAAIKSLFSFGVKTGYLQSNPAALIKTLKPKDALNERMLQEDEVIRLLNSASSQRDSILLKLLYSLGLRVSELIGLNWTDFKETNAGITVTVFGKGSKTRSLLLPQPLWAELQQLPRNEKTKAVFLSRFGNRLDRHAVHRLVKKAAEKAGINPHTSAHWLRHAHASHSLKHGAGIDLLMKSLGHSSLAVTSRYLHCQPSECTSQFIRLG